ncbi:MAG: alpha/beta hydrolase, partial [Patescibacteria group bacterium]|nr:alpha/beta hydrolase [Patescibacteria group bacterium]
MPDKHYVIVVPGLGDRDKLVTLAVKHWKQYGIIPYVHLAPWKKKEVLSAKLERLVSLVDKLSKKGKVSLVGISAGGSMVLNAYAKRKARIKAVINICGRLKCGDHVFPSLNFAAKGNPAFRESVLFCDESRHVLKKSDRKKVMTLRAMYDEVVPPSTATLKGAINK